MFTADQCDSLVSQLDSLSLSKYDNEVLHAVSPFPLDRESLFPELGGEQKDEEFGRTLVRQVRCGADSSLPLDHPHVRGGIQRCFRTVQNAAEAASESHVVFRVLRIVSIRVHRQGEHHRQSPPALFRNRI